MGAADALIEEAGDHDQVLGAELAAVAEEIEHLPAVDAGHVQVEEGQRVVIRLERVDRLAAAVDDVRGDAEARGDVADELAHFGVVVGDQQALAARRGRRRQRTERVA
ncbi:MAG TPA: hypothetical protein VF698_04115, partial [Thermoanaerobaculia bacterium]